MFAAIYEAFLFRRPIIMTGSVLSTADNRAAQPNQHGGRLFCFERGASACRLSAMEEEWT
jgi:hypothetical protein